MSGFRFPSFPSGADFSVAPLTPEVVANTGIPEPTVSDKNATPLTKALLVWLLILPIAYFIFMIVGFASVYGSGAYGIVWFLFSGGLNAFMYFAIQRVVPAWVAVFVYAQAVIFGIQLLWSIIAIIGVFGILSWLAGVSAVFGLYLFLYIAIFVADIVVTYYLIIRSTQFYHYAVAVRAAAPVTVQVIPAGQATVVEVPVYASAKVDEAPLPAAPQGSVVYASPNGQIGGAHAV